MRNLALIGLVGVSFLGGAAYVLTTPDAKAEEAVRMTETTGISLIALERYLKSWQVNMTCSHLL